MRTSERGAIGAMGAENESGEVAIDSMIFGDPRCSENASRPFGELLLARETSPKPKTEPVAD